MSTHSKIANIIPSARVIDRNGRVSICFPRSPGNAAGEPLRARVAAVVTRWAGSLPLSSCGDEKVPIYPGTEVRLGTERRLGDVAGEDHPYCEVSPWFTDRVTDDRRLPALESLAASFVEEFAGEWPLVEVCLGGLVSQFQVPPQEGE